MVGWQITSIALGAALISAAAGVPAVPGPGRPQVHRGHRLACVPDADGEREGHPVAGRMAPPGSLTVRCGPPRRSDGFRLTEESPADQNRD
jgi:hypothetical protein